MSYGTFRVRRAISRRYYHRMASSVSRSMESPFIRKVTACLAIFLVVSTLSRLPAWPAARLTGLLRWAFTTDSDFAPVLAALKRAAAGVSAQGFLAFPVTGAPAVRMAWPVNGRLTMLYGWRTDPATRIENLHEGIDISAPAGTAVRAAAAGVVTNIRDSLVYGRVIELDHGRGLMTTYSNCSEVNVILKSRVEQGDVIGTLGTPAGTGGTGGTEGAGGAAGAHLHFEVLLDGNRVDPLKYLPSL
ncbi:MAG: M23 family metallopeptidase [Ignavibacteriales bacterium]